MVEAGHHRAGWLRCFSRREIEREVGAVAQRRGTAELCGGVEIAFGSSGARIVVSTSVVLACTGSLPCGGEIWVGSWFVEPTRIGDSAAARLCVADARFPAAVVGEKNAGRGTDDCSPKKTLRLLRSRTFEGRIFDTASGEGSGLRFSAVSR